MADYIECVGMSRTERSIEKAQHLRWKRAYNAARLKVESDERRLDELVKEDEEKIFKLIPDKAFVAKYFLEERTDQMRMEGLRYKFNIPETDLDPEVTLLLWKRDEVTGEEKLVGEAGDLYTVELMSPCGDGTLTINIIVESSESRKQHQSRLFYSVFDIGHAERAYTIPSEAWFTYLMFREDEPRNRSELDARLLYIAIGDKGQLSAMCTLAHFKSFSLDDVVNLMQYMTPGRVYERPTSGEALLSMNDDGKEELLRSDPEEVEDRLVVTPSARMNLAERFDEIEIDYDARVTRSRLRQKQPRFEDIKGSPWSPKKTELVRKVVSDALDPDSEENIVSRDIWRQCLEAEKLFFPNFSRKKAKKIGLMKGKEVNEEKELGKLKVMDGDVTIWEEGDEVIGKMEVSPASSIHPSEEETYGFLSYVDDVGLAEIKDASLTLIPVDKDEEEDANIDEDPRDDSKDFMPEQEDEDSEALGEWDLYSMPSSKSNEGEGEADHDDSFPFNDSVEMLFLAKPVNESQILTINTSESSVTDSNPEENRFANCKCLLDTSRDMLADDDDDEEEDMGEVDFLYIPEV